MDTPLPRVNRRELAARIKHHRRRLGLTCSEMAEDVGCSEAAVSSWERGLTVPNGKALHALALCLGVRTDTLLGLPLRPAAPMSERRS